MGLETLNAMLAREDWQGAAAVLAPHARRADAHPSILYNFGKVLMELGRFDEALAPLERATQAAPDHQAAWFELGRAALAVERFETAQTGFARALELDPEDGDARRNLGRVALRRGAYDVAKEAWGTMAGDAEADLALYRVAAETGAPEAAAMRLALLGEHPNRAAVVRTLVRVSKGAVPLSL